MAGKRLLAVFGIMVAVILLTSLTSNSMGAEWMQYGTSTKLKYTIALYDKTSIKKLDNNIFRVWNKFVELAGRSAVGLIEVDCLNKMDRTVSRTIYDENGGVLSSSNDIEEWSHVQPDTMGEALFDIICK